jgi:hypothetical protein
MGNGYYYDAYYGGPGSFCYPNVQPLTQSYAYTLTYTGAGTTSTTVREYTSVYSRAAMYSAYAVQIRWASSDLSILSTHPLTPGMVLATSSPTFNSGSSGYYGGDSYNSGVDFTLRLAIGLGVPLFAAVLGISIFLCCRYSKSKRAKKIGMSEPDDNNINQFLPNPLPPLPPLPNGAATQENETPAFYTPYTLPGNPSNFPRNIQTIPVLSPVVAPSPIFLPDANSSLTMDPLGIATDSQEGAESLRRDQERLKARRTRLLELNRLEEEEWQLEQTIARRTSVSPPAVLGRGNVPPLPQVAEEDIPEPKPAETRVS